MNTSNQNNLIYDYIDYRLFLKNHICEKKLKNPRWNYSLWAKQLKFSDKSSLGKILQGHRHPGEKIIGKLVTYFKFSSKEEEYFRNLISLQKSKSDLGQGLQIIEKLKQKNYRRKDLNLDLDTFTLLSKWYHLAVLEFVKLKQFQESRSSGSGNEMDYDYRLIADKFNFKVNPSEIAKTLELLLRLGLVEKNQESGELRQTYNEFKIGNQIKNLAIQNYHQQTLSLAKEAITKIHPDDREITSKTISMNFNKLTEVKKFIKEFKEKFSQKFEEEDSETDAIFQLQIQLFPLTSKVNKN
ncbi:MAG: TIGR02147 family protein [Oligoflexia bacterium]|nr:TIGR02147 family protein [Oligoflexia bacterium]